MGPTPPIALPGYLGRPISPDERRRAILVLLGSGLVDRRPPRDQPSEDPASRVSG